MRSSITVFLLLLLYGCTPADVTKRVFKQFDAASTPLFRHAFVSAIDEAPVNMIPCWNDEALKKAGIRKVVMFCKGGKNPDDTLEKMVVTYSSDWKNMLYQGYQFDEAPSAWTNGTISSPGPANRDGEIVFTRHYGIDKLLKTKIRKTDTGYYLLRAKSDNRFDTTWVFGSWTHPSAIVSKIGKTLFSVELFIKKGSSTQEIVTAFRELPFDHEAVSAAQCTVVFTESGRPREAFLLNDTFSQVGKTKSWTYTGDGSIATYQEWAGSSIAKDLSWEYDGSQLPVRLTINRKTYFYHYE